jgi:hypothetical protein
MGWLWMPRAVLYEHAKSPLEEGHGQREYQQQEAVGPSDVTW